MEQLRWCEIDLKNLKTNIKNLKGLINKKTMFMAVVKNNAYGHGIVECSKVAIEAGANWLGVVNLQEAILLRKNNITAPILVLGYVSPRDVLQAAKNNISIALVSFDQLNRIEKTLGNKHKLKAHIKIETGISRLGFAETEWKELIERISKLNKSIQIEGVYSHFSSVEECNLNYANKQLARFNKFKSLFLDSLNSYSLSLTPIFHIASSAAAIILPESHFDMVRCGIAIYGLWPSEEIKKEFFAKNKQKKDFLKPVLAYKTKIIEIKKVKKGDFVGYGCAYRAKSQMTIGVISIGYGEGFDRRLSNINSNKNLGGEIVVNDRKVPIIGRICMNMAIIDLTNIVQKGKIKYEQEAIIIGQDQEQQITVDDIAEKIGTINYELIARIPAEINRIYK